MRTIDEIYKAIETDGIEVLTPEEVVAYVENERKIAARDAAFNERQKGYAEALDATAQAQRDLAQRAGDILDTLISNQPNFEVME